MERKRAESRDFKSKGAWNRLEDENHSTSLCISIVFSEYDFTNYTEMHVMPSLLFQSHSLIFLIEILSCMSYVLKTGL